MATRSYAAMLLLIAMLAIPTIAAPPAPPAEPEGMKPIFNGKDLSGWDGDPKLWSVRDGAIRGESTKENPCKTNTFLLYTAGGKEPAELKDFDLRLTYRIQGGNSGVQYRSRHLVGHKDNAWVVGGYQAEIANLPGKDGFLYEEKGTGRGGIRGTKGYLAWVGDKVEIGEDGVSKVTAPLGDLAEITKACKKGDWNEYVIIAEGNHLRHFINGVQTIDVIDNDAKNRKLAGVMALQMHAGPPMIVEFKNIRLKEGAAR